MKRICRHKFASMKLLLACRACLRDHRPDTLLGELGRKLGLRHERIGPSEPWLLCSFRLLGLVLREDGTLLYVLIGAL